MKKFFLMLLLTAFSTLTYSQSDLSTGQFYFGMEGELGGTKINGRIDNEFHKGAFIAGFDLSFGRQSLGPDGSLTAVMGTVGPEVLALQYGGDIGDLLPWDFGCQVLKTYRSGFTVGMKIGARIWPPSIYFDGYEDAEDWDSFNPNAFAYARVGYTCYDYFRIISKVGYCRGFVCTLGLMFSI